MTEVSSIAKFQDTSRSGTKLEVLAGNIVEAGPIGKLLHQGETQIEGKKTALNKHSNPLPDLIHSPFNTKTRGVQEKLLDKTPKTPAEP